MARGWVIASAAIKRLRADNDQSDAAQEALHDHWRHFSEEADRFHTETAIELDKTFAEIRLFYIREALALLAAVYIVGFAGAGAWAFLLTP